MANEIYNTTWWGNAIDTAITAGTNPDFFGSQMKLLTSEQNSIASFTNGTVYPLSTFVSNGKNITSLIKSNGFAGCVSNGRSYKVGDKVKVSFEYIKNSGDNLRVLFSSIVTGAGTTVSDIQNISSSELFEHTFTINSTGIAYLQLGTGNASHSINASIKNIRAELIRCDLDQIEAKKCLADWIHRTALQDLKN